MNSVEWVDIELDADVGSEEGDRLAPAAAGARFRLEELAAHLGYKPGVAGDDDALGLAQMLVERVAESLDWAEAPWTLSRIDGSSARGIMGPGAIAPESWAALVESFQNVCEFYGNHSMRSVVGTTIEQARQNWFCVEPAKEKRGAAPRS